MTNSNCCPTNTYYKKTDKNCVTIPVKNCDEYSDDKCLTCSSNFTKVADNLCLEVQHGYCKKFDGYVESNTCGECYNSGEYVFGASCCLLNYFYNGASCESISDNNFQYCKKIDTSSRPPKCLECLDANFYTSNDNCCPIYSYYDTSSKTCVVLSTLGLANCKKVDHGTFSGSCSENECDATHYLHHGHCCELTKYWNTQKATCELITADPNTIVNCNKYNDYDVC